MFGEALAVLRWFLERESYIRFYVSSFDDRIVAIIKQAMVVDEVWLLKLFFFVWSPFLIP